MSNLLFIFGRTYELSLHELQALTSHPITKITTDVMRVENANGSIVPEAFINRLGGTVKIAIEKGTIDTLDPESIVQYLGDFGGGSATFGLSFYGEKSEKVDPLLLKGVKKILASRGMSSRYVAAHEGSTLSSVVIEKQHVHELVIIAVEKRFIVGETVAVQDFEMWNERDYGRPFADPKAGMLPPKVARMAVNIANESPPKADQPLAGKVLLDPFCGMGTILGEAFLAGFQVIGSDQSEVVIGKAKKNIEWLIKMTRSVPVIRFCVSDATHVSEHVVKESVDAIVTEPYMGPAFGGNVQFPISNDQLKNIIKGLEKLYIGCLRDWLCILKPGSKVVIALPEYAASTRTFFVKNVIDRCENIGYTVTLGPLPYSRPQAIVRRKFFVLTKK